MGLYPCIIKARLRALKNKLDRMEGKRISTEDLVKIAVFVVKNKYFQSNGQDKHQILVTAIGTKFSPICSCILMDKIETRYL